MDISNLLAKREDFLRGRRVARTCWRTLREGTDLRQDPPRPVSLLVFDDCRRFDLLQEVQNIRQLQNKYILNVVAFVMPESDSRAMLVVPYMKQGLLAEVVGMELAGLEVPGWNATKKSVVVLGTAIAMAHMHSVGVLHGNLDLHHILLNEDFEPAVMMPRYGRYEAEDLMEILIPSQFKAPEIVPGKKPTGAADVFSFGMCLYFLCTESALFEGVEEGRTARPRDLDGAYFKLLSSGHRFVRPPGIKDSFWDLIQACWAGDPWERPSFRDIIRRLCTEEWVFPGTDPWLFRKYQEEMLKHSVVRRAQMESGGVTTANNALKRLALDAPIIRECD